MAESVSSKGVGHEPVRVKVYGLFPLTRRRYLSQAFFGIVALVTMLVGWFLSWPRLRGHLSQATLPPAMRVTVAVLDQVPWILLATAALKGLETFVVLRCFARKEAAARPAPPDALPQP